MSTRIQASSQGSEKSQYLAKTWQVGLFSTGFTGASINIDFNSADLIIYNNFL